MKQLTLTMLFTLVLGTALIAQGVGPNSGYINVKDYGAQGDGSTDDTYAIQQAIDNNWTFCGGHSNNYRTLYLPEGTYVVSNTIFWMRWLRFAGEGKDKTIIKLKDNASGYGNPGSPKPVLRCRFTGLACSPYDGSENSSFNNYIEHLTVDCGSGNSGAIGIRYSQHNQGALRDVDIVSSSKGAIGLDLSETEFGPGLIQDVYINNFSMGIETPGNVSHATMEHITIENCDHALNCNFPMSIYDLDVINCDRGITNTNMLSQLVLVDGYFTGGSSSYSAIENSRSMYIRDISSSGFQSALKDNGTVISGNSIDERASGPHIDEVFPSPDEHLKLCIEDPVEFNEPVSDWVYVSNATELKNAIANNESTIYLSFTQDYTITEPLVIDGNVRRIIGGQALINGNPSDFNDGADPMIIFRNNQPLTIEHLNWQHYPNNPHCLIDTDQPVHFKSSGRSNPGGDIKNTSNASGGKLFIEDALIDVLLDHPMDVWMRHLNVENNPYPGESGRVYAENPGGNMWILGLKTEAVAKHVVTTGGGRSEVLGGFFRDHKDSDGIPYFETDNSSISASYFVYSYDCCHNRALHAREKRGGTWNSYSPGQGTYAVTLYNGFENGDQGCGDPGDTDPPASPSGLSASGNDGSVSLNWNDNGEGDLAGYNVYRSTSSGGSYSQINGSLVSNSDYTDNSATNGTTYYYVVTAEDGSGNESGYSGEASATPSGGGTGSPIPGLIEAENYSAMNGIETEPCSEGGENVGWIDNGDWMDYEVDVASAGDYTVDFRVAASSNNIKFDLKEGGTVLTSVNSSSTGGWQNWKTVTKSVSLSAGVQTLRIAATGSSWNINYMEFTSGGSDPTYTLTVNNGSGDGAYTEGTVVDIAADAPPAGQVFDNWTGNTGIVADVNDPTTTATIPAWDTELTANYKSDGGGDCTTDGQITYQKWDGISGTAVSDLTGNSNFPDNPSGTSTRASMEAPTNTGDDYGARLIGTICAPETGTYYFWIAADDNCELWLSSDENESNESQIAGHTGWTNSREWNKYSSQKSSGISLTAGNKYFIEALMKEAGGGDNLAVGWRKPSDGDGTSPVGVIPGSALSEYSGGDPGDTDPPAPPSGLSASGNDGSVSLNWNDNGEGDLAGYNVYRSTSSGGSYSQINGSLVSNSDYTDNGVTNGTTYYYVVTAEDGNGNESGYSGEASATPSDGGGTSGDYYSYECRWDGPGDPAYLADDGSGKVVYQSSNDASAHWFEVSEGSYIALENRSTGNVMNIVNNQDWVECNATSTGNTKAQWTLQDAGSGYYRFIARDNSNNAIHVENTLGYAQHKNYNGNTGWYSAMWDRSYEGTKSAQAANSYPETFEVYPNPANNILYINTSSDNYAVKLYNLQGKVVYSAKDISGLSTIDVSGLQDGLYIANIVSYSHTETIKVNIK
ncbi:MAG: carbohydrate-binding protein [Bacteroidetes bacterium]|jgi:hypothetical protein|nr:carbohydrate-binding protein [Bacteroidota bacterium]